MLYNPESRSSREALAMQLLGKLTSCGFEPLEREGTNEAVYYREVDGTEGKMRVLVYTTVVPQGDHFEVRTCGADSIRVCAVYYSDRAGERGLVKETRTHRTGEVQAIVDRVYNRMREVYKKAKGGCRCNRCGAPTFKSKKGNNVCADLCWKSDEDLRKDESKRRSRYVDPNRRLLQPPRTQRPYWWRN